MFKTLALEISSTASPFTDNLRAACFSSTSYGTSLSPLYAEMHEFDCISPPLASVDRPARQYINCSPPHDVSNRTVSLSSLMLAEHFCRVFIQLSSQFSADKKKGKWTVLCSMPFLNGLKWSEKIAMLLFGMLQKSLI